MSRPPDPFPHGEPGGSGAAAYALTHGGPANATHVFSTLSFDIGMSAGQLGMGAAVALAILPALAVLIVVLTFYLRRE